MNSYASIEQKVCPVCCKKHDTGIILDKRLRNTLEPATVTGYEMCPDCQGRDDEGYVALVGVSLPIV